MSLPHGLPRVLGVKVEFVLKSLTGPIRYSASVSHQVRHSDRKGAESWRRRTGGVIALPISLQPKPIGDGGFASPGRVTLAARARPARTAAKQGSVG